MLKPSHIFSLKRLLGIKRSRKYIVMSLVDGSDVVVPSRVFLDNQGQFSYVIATEVTASSEQEAMDIYRRRVKL